jgi:hypothetical protein
MAYPGRCASRVFMPTEIVKHKDPVVLMRHGDIWKALTFDTSAA